MKKLIISTLMLVTAVIVVPSAVEAKEAATSVTTATAPQIYTQRRTRRGYNNRRWNNRRSRTVTTTRIRWVGPYRYRETIRTTYFANGRTRTDVIRRVRLNNRRTYRNN